MFRMVMALCSLVLVACEQPAPTESASSEAAAQSAPADGWTQASPDGRSSISAATAEDAGRYMVVFALCNDCHTAGWLPAGDVPEDQWLLGNPVGYEGPWGVTFPSNLRLRAQEWTEDQWVETLRTRKALDPMPWIAVNAMSEKDARALYRYARNLGAGGQHMPTPIPPGAPLTEPYTTLRVWPAGTVLEPTTPAAAQ